MSAFELTDAMLTQMRAQVQNALPDTCIIYTAGTVSDGAGGWTETKTARGTVACRVDPFSQGQEQITAAVGSEKTTIIYQLTVPYDAPISANNIVETGGEEYEIVQISAEHSRRVVRRAVIARVE